jgi:two-component sensor histidine kinase
MLDVSKLKTGLLGLYRENCRLEEIIARARPSLERKASLRKVDLKVSVESNLPEVYCDAEKVGRVIINLVTNAIKFSGDPGEVRLWARREGASGQVVVGVSDNGPGIDAAGLSKIFKRFKQLDAKPRSGVKGFGLGLSIARQLVNLNLGQLSVESGPKVGSTFSFTLPGANLACILPRYLKRLKRVRNRPQVASMVTARIDQLTADNVAAEVNAFLNCTLRQNDLAFRIGRCRWLIILPLEREEIDAFIARANRLHQEANRNRPHGPLPEVELRIEGTWPVVGQCKKLFDRMQELVDSSADDRGAAGYGDIAGAAGRASVVPGVGRPRAEQPA